MKRYNRNIMVVAENNGVRDGFNVFLVFSGQREYLFTHRHNGIMYGFLKGGICLGDLQRRIRDMRIPAICGPQSHFVATEQFWNNMRYLMAMIDEYIEDREQCA